MEKLCSGTVHLLSGLEFWDLIPSRREDERGHQWEGVEETTPKDEVGFVIIRKKGEHPIHHMRRFLVSRERKGYQCLELLIVIQCVEGDETFTENTLRVSGRRGADQF